MPPDEGDALYDAAIAAAAAVPTAPWVEVGSYCGRSTIWLGAAARESGTTLFAVDHHRGSEENQAGWEWHDADVVDARIGKMDTLPFFRAAIHDAALEDHVVGVVGRSPVVARHWSTPLAFVFIDGGHGVEPARRGLRRLDATRRGGRHARDPRRVPRSRRRRTATVRADLRAGARERSVPARIGHRILAGAAPCRLRRCRTGWAAPTPWRPNAPPCARSSPAARRTCCCPWWRSSSQCDW